MPRDLLERLKAGPVLVADGATGTMLLAAGLPSGTPPEQWNLSQPEKIRELHETYLMAGSDIVLSNSFGGNRIKLARAGLRDSVNELNRRAAEIVRQAADAYEAFAAGDMGPTGELLAPLGDLEYEDAVDAYAEQARALAEGGVDCIWIETMSDLNEARAAVEGAQMATDLPILCSLSFDSHGRTMMGVKPLQAAQLLQSLGVAAMGANCGASLDDTMRAIEEMAAESPGIPLIAKPNAGLPHLVGDESVYDTTPEEMARYAAGFVARGARIVGGCCGSTPAHIRAIHEAVRRL